MIEQLQQNPAESIALSQGSKNISYGGLLTNVQQRVDWLHLQSKQKENQQGKPIKRVGLLMDNCFDWLYFDLACQHAKLCLVPIPSFFSTEQKMALVNDSALDLVILDKLNHHSFIELLSHAQQCDYQPLATPFAEIKAVLLSTMLAKNEQSLMPPETAKVTFTSGSTGHPKGVCLSLKAQITVANALIDRIGLTKPRHLSLLPFATLLENIAGLYAPLLASGTIVFANEQNRGFSGSQLANPQVLLSLINESRANTMILVPELLQVLVQGCKQGWQPPKSLRFIAVGGSKVATPLLKEAAQCGLPVYQGYGLSESCSVVSLNSIDDNSLGNVGRLLPHVNGQVINGELQVSGANFLGYLNKPASWNPKQVATGDLAELNDNQLSIIGRAKNLLINSFGRNISPEWVEAELLATGAFYQAVVIGDAKPFCCALLVPMPVLVSQAKSKAQLVEHIEQVITRLNTKLPDYAQIKDHLLLLEPMTPKQGLFTDNFRPKRDAIIEHFNDAIEQLYRDYSQFEQVTCS